MSNGGAETYSLNLASKLSQLNNEVNVYANFREDISFEIIKNLKVDYVKTILFSKNPGNPFSLELIQKLMSQNYDIIHVHQLLTSFNIASSVIGRLRNIPIVLTDHGGGWKFFAAFPQICAKFPNAFSAVSNFSLQWLLHFAPGKQNCVTYAGVDTEVFNPNYDVQKLKQDLDLHGFGTVLSVCRILPGKGLEVLIKAFSRLNKDNKLLIVGPIHDLEYFNYLKDLANRMCPGRICFTGAVKASDLPYYYNLCDVYVQPSVYVDLYGRYHRFSELLGIAKFEAMSCGKPVIVSKTGGLPEKISVGINGFVFDPGNDRQLAFYLDNLLSDDSLRIKMGAENSKMVRRDLTWDKVALQTIKLYRSL